MKTKNPFSALNKFEFTLWIVSFIVVLLSFIFSPATDILTLIASLIGVTSLIFIAKGMVFGQILIIIFAVLYGIVSWRFAYYGEMLTYICLSLPAAVAALISCLKNPYAESAEVKVNKSLTPLHVFLLFLLSVLITVPFYFILKFLGTANLIFSTISVTTSFFAASLTFLRSPLYALGYAANDVVLIVLWALAAIDDISYLPMIFCFIMFLVNDLYGYINWRKMEKRQAS